MTSPGSITPPSPAGRSAFAECLRLPAGCLLAAAVAILLVGCDGFLTPETPPPVKVTGLVVDQATEAPLQGAEVSVEGGSTVLTGPDGTYMVGGLRPGIVYRIVVQKDGYETVAKRFETPGRDQSKPRITVDFSLPPSQGTSQGAGDQ
jgi:hypothetical protein